jgi:proline racemase
MSVRFARMVTTIDSHTEGNATRVIVGGVAVPPGETLLEQRRWLWRSDDALRRMLNFEPRGNGMMCSVLLLPPERVGSDFAVVIMEQDEYVPMCGHCIIGTATTVVANGMVRATEPVTTVRFDTPAGIVVCDVAVRGGTIGAVSFDNVESFLLKENVPLEVEGHGRLNIDIAYGGDFYSFVDADRLGLELSPHNDARLIDAWRRISAAVAKPGPGRPPRAARHRRVLSGAVHLREDHVGRRQANHPLPAGIARPLAVRHRHQCARRPHVHARRDRPRCRPAL